MYLKCQPRGFKFCGWYVVNWFLVNSNSYKRDILNISQKYLCHKDIFLNFYCQFLSFEMLFFHGLWNLARLRFPP